MSKTTLTDSERATLAYYANVTVAFVDPPAGHEEARKVLLRARLINGNLEVTAAGHALLTPPPPAPKMGEVSAAIRRACAASRTASTSAKRGQNIRDRNGAKVTIDHPLFAGFTLTCDDVIRTACQAYPSRLIRWASADGSIRWEGLGADLDNALRVIVKARDPRFTTWESYYAAHPEERAA